MSLSRDFTVLRFVDQAFGRFGLDHNNEFYVRRMNLVNFTVSHVMNLIYDLVSNAYMTPITILPDTTGRYYVSGASYEASTKRLTATMNTNFGSGDVGKYVTFRVGALVYTAQVTAFVSTTVIEINGSNLPSSNQTVDDVMLAATTPTGNTMSIADLRIMRTGQPLKLELESTATTSIKPMSVYDLEHFNINDPRLLSSIGWAYSGEEILLAKGSSLTTYGTFTLRYPRIPNQVTANTDKLDVPDGAAMGICLLHFQNQLAVALKREFPEYAGEMKLALESLYRTYIGEVNREAVREKASAIG